MAYKTSPNSLIHCTECGEDYSATYRRCPFCGARNTPPPSSSPSVPEADPAPRPASGRSAAHVNLEDTYVFNGQDLFDEEKTEEDYTPMRPRGGKRLAEKPSSNPFANADINWPRMITFVCSLVIIVAAMVIVFTVVYPQLRGDPTLESQSPSFPASDPVGGNTQPGDPNTTDPGTDSTDPGTVPSTDVPPAGSGELRGISFKRSKDDDFTLKSGESHTIELNFNPANWSGTVTWTSSNTQYATVDANGKVTNVNDTNQLRSVTITAAAEGFTLQSKVYCKGVPATEPPASNPPASNPPASNPPASNPPASNPPSSGSKGTVVNATDGLRVRSGPGTDYDRIGKLPNGATVNILEKASNGWYKISYTGADGTLEGYVLGDYISVN